MASLLCRDGKTDFITLRKPNCDLREVRGQGCKADLGHRDSQAPIVPSLERVRQHSMRLQSSLHFSLSPHKSQGRMLSCPSTDETNLDHSFSQMDMSKVIAFIL